MTMIDDDDDDVAKKVLEPVPNSFVSSTHSILTSLG